MQPCLNETSRRRQARSLSLGKSKVIHGFPTAQGADTSYLQVVQGSAGASFQQMLCLSILMRTTITLQFEDDAGLLLS